ncbi:MAG: hypothetical protein RL095_3164 [Verrucomicrobiota bacterium]|jgi:Ca2+-binding EF-hand superfamily protein
MIRALILCSVFAAFSAQAQEPAPASQKLEVKPVDKDGDGKFSFDEFTDGLDEATKTALKPMFEKFDTDKDGFLTMAEIQAQGKAAGGKQLEIKPVDKDGDGKFSFEEFADGISDESLKGAAKQAFDQLDADKDGFVTMAELQSHKK